MIDWKAYVAHVTAGGRDIRQLRTRLAFLEAGLTGRPEAEADTTEREKALLRTTIEEKVAAMMGIPIPRTLASEA